MAALQTHGLSDSRSLIRREREKSCAVVVSLVTPKTLICCANAVARERYPLISVALGGGRPFSEYPVIQESLRSPTVHRIAGRAAVGSSIFMNWGNSSMRMIVPLASRVIPPP